MEDRSDVWTWLGARLKTQKSVFSPPPPQKCDSPGGVLLLLLDDDDEALESEESLDESLELDPDDDFDDLESGDLDRIAATKAAFEWANKRSDNPVLPLK